MELQDRNTVSGRICWLLLAITSTPIAAYAGTSDPVSPGQLLQIGLAVILIFTLIGVVLGLTGKAIFYADRRDLVISMLPSLAPPAVVFTAALATPDAYDQDHGIIGVVVLVTFALAGLWVMHRSWLHNQGNAFIAIPVGVAKIALGIVALVLFLGMLMNKKRSDRVRSGIFFGLTSILMAKLVNGKNPRSSRGKSGTKDSP